MGDCEGEGERRRNYEGKGWEIVREKREGRRSVRL